MKIGFVSTWFERGAAYVTRQYADLLQKAGHEVYIYARGEKFAIGNPEWDLPNVTWGRKLYDTSLDFKHFSNWIKKNEIQCIFFNEQREMQSIIKLKIYYPEIKIGTYIDYYTQDTVKDFRFYDFLICNTKRHYSVFSQFDQCYYIPWGTNTELYTFEERTAEKVRFFHSAGMSNRKGTDVLVDAFIEGRLFEDAELIIHTQMPIEKLTNRKSEELNNYNITVIQKTVTAPGLYYMGDVYVYPTTLDGLGLTMYEALSSGMPVIATNCAPMNEVISNNVGRLVDVDEYKCRWDAYYWPLAFVNKNSLIDAMRYYVENKEKLNDYRVLARRTAEDKWNWESRKELVNAAFENSVTKEINRRDLTNDLKAYKKQNLKSLGKSIIPFMPKFLQQLYFRNR
jgi:glycosyltransferase involved in cell wall biosynthesis